LIQLSSPIHGPSGESGVSPGVPGEENKTGKTGKHNKQGAFARLLESLTGRLRKKGEGSAGGVSPRSEKLKGKAGEAPGEKAKTGNELTGFPAFFPPGPGDSPAPEPSPRLLGGGRPG
jgi:hypothetical protein